MKYTWILVVNWSAFTYRQKFDDFKYAFCLSATVDLRINGRVSWESPEKTTMAPPKMFWSSQTSFSVPLQAGDLLICMFSGNINAIYSVQPHSNKVTSISDESNARATSFCDPILAKSNEIKVFLVPLEALRKYIPPVSFFTVSIKKSYAILCSWFSHGT